MKVIAGIEEAGRGPVIGPMVMVGLTIAEEDEHKLKDIGAKDSKLLSPLQREDLYDSIMQIVKKHKIVILSPQDVDNAVLSRTSNLNHLESDTTIKILNELSPDKALIDCPSNNTTAYAGRIRASLKKKTMELVVEHKADVHYPIVSAASIIAKVTRDAEIEKIKKEIKINFGSGYPSDPLTQRFLREQYNNPQFSHLFRKSWASYQALLPKKTKTLSEF